MKFYVASGVSNAEKVNQTAAALTASGHTRTYDWTTHGDVSKADSEFKRHVAASELRGVLEAELVVLLLPGRFGTHAELGIALGTYGNKRILLWSEIPAPFDGTEGFCVFYHHPAVERVVCSFDELLTILKNI
ncbi:MAG: hypothetical protein ABFC56_06190 [Clostridiaceae bacterium]